MPLDIGWIGACGRNLVKLIGLVAEIRLARYFALVREDGSLGKLHHSLVVHVNLDCPSAGLGLRPTCSREPPCRGSSSFAAKGRLLRHNILDAFRKVLEQDSGLGWCQYLPAGFLMPHFVCVWTKTESSVSASIFGVSAFFNLFNLRFLLCGVSCLGQVNDAVLFLCDGGIFWLWF